MNSVTLFEKAVSAINAGQLEQGIDYFRQAVVKNPHDAETVASLGQALLWAGFRKAGLEEMEVAGQLLINCAKKTRKTNDLIALAEQLQTCHDFKQSLYLVEQAVQIHNKDARAFQLMAQAHLRLNNRKQALLAIKLAVKLSPTDVTLKLLSAEINSKYGETSKAQKQLKTLLSYEARLSPELVSRIHREYAITLDKLGEYDKVFPHLHRAASISRHLPDLAQQDSKLVPQLLKQYQAGFTSDVFNHQNRNEPVDNQESPVFLVGFLRSGTTLVQEVLAAHSGVMLADENDFIASMRIELERMSTIKGNVPEQLANCSPQDIRHLREFYWKKIKDYYGSTFNDRVFVDKTTMNLIDLGLITFVFPEAKILYVQRDPRDVCLSCYMQTMAPSAVTVHFSDWQQTLSLYVVMMEWWQHIHRYVKHNCLQLRYEHAVSSFVPVFKQVFCFLGLPWQENVTDFHRSAADRFVASPSYHQVSRPLYQSSVGRWKQYSSEFEQAPEGFHQLTSKMGY